LSWSNGQNLRIFQQFQQQKELELCDCHDQIWTDLIDHENFVISGMVMVKIGLTILTIEPQFGQMVKKPWSSDPHS
jgi:hypothetical protein